MAKDELGAFQDLDEFLYRITHDLKASFRAMREIPQWIVEDLEDASIELPADTKESIELLQSHARKLDNIIQGLLIYSRVSRQSFGTGGQIEVAIERSLSSLEGRQRLSLKTRLCPETPMMDTSCLQTVLEILLKNSLQATKAECKVLIWSRAVGKFWVLDILDNGPGIPEKFRHKVLKPMEKASNEGASRAGMGLAILARILALHNGEIEIMPPLRRGGTLVRLHLPLEAELPGSKTTP
ncbi:MAG: sensor histidine kinase [Mangrovicoccus sp.]